MDLMRVAYDDRPIVEEKVTEKADGQASEAGQRTGHLVGVAGKHKAQEPADVQIGRELEKPVGRKSRKVSFYLGEYIGEACCSDRVSWA